MLGRNCAGFNINDNSSKLRDPPVVAFCVPHVVDTAHQGSAGSRGLLRDSKGKAGKVM